MSELIGFQQNKKYRFSYEKSKKTELPENYKKDIPDYDEWQLKHQQINGRIVRDV